MKRIFILSIMAFSALLLAHCSGTEGLSKDLQEKLKEEGANAVASAQLTLLDKLIAQVNDSGTEKAVSYCVVHADSILDRSSDELGYPIYRRSIKFRNPDNKPNEQEKNILKVYEKALEKKEALHPMLHYVAVDSSVYYYSPIIVQPLCLNCHGSKDNGFDPETFSEVIKTYPKDNAFNYSVGELRGMWVVELKNYLNKQ
jgi:hypothetical protein